MSQNIKARLFIYLSSLVLIKTLYYSIVHTSRHDFRGSDWSRAGPKHRSQTGDKLIHWLLFPLPKIGMGNIYLSEMNNMLLSKNKLKHSFMKQFIINKYEIISLILHVKKRTKNECKLCCCFTVCRTRTPILKSNRPPRNDTPFTWNRAIKAQENGDF